MLSTNCWGTTRRTAFYGDLASFMKIAVTGGAGYIGSVCVELLCEEGHEVVVIDNLSEGHRAAVDPRARLEVADLAETARVTEILKGHGAEAVIHYAANALVGESMSDPGKYFRNNVAGGVSLLEAMVAAEVGKIVFSSTCATYGEPERVPIVEDTPQAPVNPYGESKLMFEKVLRWYEEIHGISVVIFRYFNAAGASKRFGEDHRIETHLIPNALFVPLGRREELQIFGADHDTPDGTPIRDYIHVSDLAEIHRLAVEREVDGAFNLGVGTGYSVREVIEACREVTGHEIPAREVERREGDPPILVAGNDKVVETFGWRPRFDDLRGIVQDAWNWHQANPEGYGD